MARQDTSSPIPRCCSIPVLKFGLAVYNILLLGCAGCLIVVTVWNIATKHAHLPLLSSSIYPSVVGMLLVAGLLSLVGGVLGCIALAREDRCTLVSYIFLVVLVLVLEGVAGVKAYIYEENLPFLLQDSLSDVISTEYYVTDDVTLAVDDMQQEFRCCGAISYLEWKDSRWHQLIQRQFAVPDSCCKTPTPGCGYRDHPSNIWYSGCIHGLTAFISDQLLMLGAIGCGLSLLQVVGVAVACCLYVILAKTP